MWPSSALRILLAGLGVDQDQRADDLRVGERAAQRQEAALAHAGQHGALDAEVRQQRRQVVGASRSS